MYLSSAGIKLTVMCVCMSYVVIPLYTVRQQDKMLMDTRKMATTLHFAFVSGRLTLLHVKKVLTSYPVVLEGEMTAWSPDWVTFLS